MPALEIPSPNGMYLLSVREHNVVLRSTVDGREIFLTQDGTEENRWRVDFVDPVIALFTPGLSITNWSPGSGQIAAYRDDFRGVERRPRMHNLKLTDEVVYFYHARAGGTLERTTL
ncbi:MAG TPA: hypothetical protein VKR27_07310, partial [Acidimicrobiales bacterium]|nr:hypothetical protein [Acidimicrobiales bacterium]